MPYLIDDGTLDTVIRCECGQEHRFNYEPADNTDTDNDETTTGYEDFVADCIAEVADSCECHETEE